MSKLGCYHDLPVLREWTGWTKSMRLSDTNPTATGSNPVKDSSLLRKEVSIITTESCLSRLQITQFTVKLTAVIVQAVGFGCDGPVKGTLLLSSNNHLNLLHPDT